MTLSLAVRNILIALLICGINGKFAICFGKTVSFYTAQYEYDENGMLTFETKQNGAKAEYKYNQKGLLAKIIYPRGSVSYAYDANGNRILMENENGKTEYKYDAFDRLIEVIFRYSPEKRILYEYDPWSRMSSITILDQNRVDYQVKYQYDIIGNLTSIDDGIGRIEYEYHPDKGKVVRHLPNGTKTNYSFSPLGELNNLEHLDRHNKLIASYSYEYNPPGKVSRVVEKTTEGIKTTRYEWDQRGYLKILHLPDDNTIEYEYNLMGNRILERGAQGTVHYKYDDFGRLIRAGDRKYKWNKNGTLISLTEKGAKTRIRYNGRGLPSLIRTSDATVRCKFDGDGNIIYIRVGEVITYYLPNPLAPQGNTLVAFDNVGKIKGSFFYSNGLISHEVTNGKAKYFLKDGFGNIPRIADIQSRIVMRQQPTSFNTDLPLSLKLRHSRDPLFVRAWGLIEKGQQLPLPSKDMIEAHDKYWTEGRYWDQDPYYRKVIAPLSSGTWASGKGGHNQIIEFGRNTFRTWVPWYSQVEDLFRIGVSGWMRSYGHLVESAFTQLDKEYGRAGIKVTPIPSIDDYTNELGITPTKKDLFGDVVSLVPKGFGMEPVQQYLDISGKVDWLKDAVTASIAIQSLSQMKEQSRRQSLLAKKAHSNGKYKVSFLITDFGIKQWKPALKTGADFSNAENRVFSDIPKSGQILIVMPPDQEFRKKTKEQLTQDIFKKVKARVDKGLAVDTNTFELQIVQHIGIPGYIDPKRQKMVNEFGECAYKAIGMVNDYLEAKNLPVYNYAIAGSNGTKVLTENVQAWASYLIGVSLYDGRAFSTPTIETIKTLGEKNVHIFNTGGDWPAPDEFFLHSIANHEVAKDLKRRFPGIQLMWLQPKGQINIFGVGHVAGMNPISEFIAKEFKGRSYTAPTKATSRDFYPRFQLDEDDSDCDDGDCEDDDDRYGDSGNGDCQPFCGDDGPGGPGGGGGPFGGGTGSPFTDSFKSIEATLGGIKLDATAQFTGNLGNIKGAVYDPDRQCLVLVSDTDAGVSLPFIKPEDLAVALMLVFGPNPQDPQFSLDPADPKNPEGKWLKAVYMPKKIIASTPFGDTLFKADWLLKQYSFGVIVDENGKLRERKSLVKGFKSTKDLMFEADGESDGEESWARYWIVSDDMKIRKSGSSIYFESARMRVKAKKQVPDPTSRTGLRDVDTKDPISTMYADLFTKLYNEIGKESHEFERVRQLAKAVAIAKWMKQENIPFDVDWVNEYMNKRVETTDKVTALSTQWKQTERTPFQEGNRRGIRTSTHTLYLFGGVDLTVTPRYIADNGTAKDIKNKVITKLQHINTGPVFSVKTKKANLRAVVLPLTHSGQALWKNTPLVNKGGVRFRLNSEGDVVGSIDGFENSAEYTYDGNHKLKTVKMTRKNGWKLLAEKQGQGSDWTIIDPRGNRRKYHYGTTGLLKWVEIDDNKISDFHYDSEKKMVEVNHPEHTEMISYNEKGLIKEYIIRKKAQGNTTSIKEEKLSLAYDDSNNINSISGTGIGQINISYSKDRPHPVSVRTPLGTANYVYDTRERLKDIHLPEGSSIRCLYDGNKVQKLKIKCRGKEAELIFEKGRIAKTKNFMGGSEEYKYTDNGMLNSIVGPHGFRAEYFYDEKNSLSKMVFPDGRWIEYQYGESPSKNTRSSSPLKTLKIIHHASSTPVKEASSRSKGIDVLKYRIQDIKEAGKNLKNGLIIDLFAEEKSTVHLNTVDSNGSLHRADSETAHELRKLLRYTANTKGKLGQTLLTRWQRFYEKNLSHLNRPISWVGPHGQRVKLKPILIIKSNEVNHKYANLEKVPVLSDNFTIFIASKPVEKRGVQETSAKEMATKINNIPKLSRENVVFAIRLPKMKREIEREWGETIAELERMVGKENVLFNPSKEDFNTMLHDREKEIIVIELTHTNGGITLEGNEKYTSRDILKGGDLSHIKYLIAGFGTCSLPKLENGKLAASLRKKGVGIMNTSYREVSTETALRRLKQLIRILNNIEEVDLPAYYLLDMIDQLGGTSGEGTTNQGKVIDYQRNLYSAKTIRIASSGKDGNDS